MRGESMSKELKRWLTRKETSETYNILSPPWTVTGWSR